MFEAPESDVMLLRSSSITFSSGIDESVPNANDEVFNISTNYHFFLIDRTDRSSTENPTVRALIGPRRDNSRNELVEAAERDLPSTNNHHETISATDESCESKFFNMKETMDFRLIYPCELEDTIDATWKQCTKNGSHKIIEDEDLKIKTWQLKGTVTATVFGRTPKANNGSLHMRLPICLILLKYPAKNFSFELKILDSNQFFRRFRFGSFYKAPHIDIFSTKVPIALFKGWNYIQINLLHLTRSVYRTRYLETTSIEIHANVRIGRIMFMAHPMDDFEIPTQNRLFEPQISKLKMGALFSICSEKSGQVINYKSIFPEKN